MKNFKKLSVFILFCLILTNFTGCASKTDAFFDAIEKTATMKSYSSKMDGIINLSSPEITEQNQIALDLSNINISANGDTIVENDNDSKSKMNVSVGIMGMNIAMDVMVDTKVENDKVIYKSFIQIPDMLKAMGLGDIDYLYIDSDQIEEFQKQYGESKEIDPSKYITINNEFKKLSAGIISFTKDYSNKNKDFIQVVEGKEITLNSKLEKADEYVIELDNNKVKDYLKAYLSDDKRKEELQSFIDKMNEISPQEDIENSSDITNTKNFEDAIKDIDSMEDFIGSEGITLAFYVKDGYIVKMNSKFDLIGENNTEMKYTYNMTLFNINEKLDVEIPTKDEVNSINFIDLFKLFEQQIPLQQ